MQMIRNVVKVSLNTQMELFTLATLLRTNEVVMDKLFGMIKQYIRDIGEKV